MSAIFPRRKIDVARMKMLRCAPWRSPPFGVWRSLVARFVRDEEVAGSNPVTPTIFSWRPATRKTAQTSPPAEKRQRRPDHRRQGGRRRLYLKGAREAEKRRETAGDVSTGLCGVFLTQRLRRFHHIRQRTPGFFPLTGFQTTIGIDPQAFDGNAFGGFLHQIDHVRDTRHVR